MIPLHTMRAQIVDRITGIPLGEPVQVSLTIDEDWSPRIQGEIVAPYTLDLAPIWLPDMLWKYQGDTVTLNLETLYGPGFTIAALTAAYGGSVAQVTAQHGGSMEAVTAAHTRPWHPGEHIQPVSAATALWGGSVAAVTTDHEGDVAAITHALRQPGGTYLFPATDRQVFRLRARTRTPDRIGGTYTLEVASEDVRLHDYRHTDTTVLLSTHTRLRSLVADVLGRIAKLAGFLHTIQLAPGPDITIADGQEWTPGQTAWEFLHPILESVGWQLYTPADGVYRLEPRQTTTAPHNLDRDRDLIDYTPVTDLKEAFYDGAILEYVDAPEDNPAQRYDVYVPQGASRIMHDTRPGTRTIPGAAERIVERSRTRAAIANAQATISLSLEPGHRVEVRAGDYPEYGTITAITHTYPGAKTALKLRDIAI